MHKHFCMNLDSGFSVMNLICTAPRASLSESNLDGIMHVSIKSSDILSESDVEKKLFPFWL